MSLRADAPVLDLRGIEKSYGAVRALSGVSFALRAGEVLGLLGDNGAGKSTLVRCISGTHQPDAGEIRVDGDLVELRNPEQARGLGIETVYQELALVDTLDVAGNLFLNRELRRRGVLGRLFGWMDRAAMRARAAETLARLEIRIPSIAAPVAALSGGQRQAVAVSRAVAWGRHIVVLDEPAAALGVEQASHLIELTQRLREEGVGVVLVSHNMQHVLAACSRVVVLRHGTVVADRETAGLTAQDLVGLITGGATDIRGVGG